MTTTIGSEGETCRIRPNHGPAEVVLEVERPAAGTIPRRRMSSVNEVMVSSWAIFGSLTKVPLPRLADEVVPRGRDRRARRGPSAARSRGRRRAAARTGSRRRSRACSIRASTRSLASDCLVAVALTEKCIVLDRRRWSRPRLAIRPLRADFVRANSENGIDQSPIVCIHCETMTAFDELGTEARDAAGADLDLRTTRELVELMNTADATVAPPSPERRRRSRPLDRRRSSRGSQPAAAWSTRAPARPGASRRSTRPSASRRSESR